MQSDSDHRKIPPNLTSKFHKGVEEFNSRQFFDCHETLEDVWKQLDGEPKELTQGIIQIAVGYYHLGRQNRIGALKLLRRGVERAEKVDPQLLGINIPKFVATVKGAISTIESESESQTSQATHPVIEFKSD